MGDIARASVSGADCVIVNKHFTCIFYDGYMKARNLFCERNNINALPVADKNNVLLGDYSRWDDLLILKYVLKREQLTQVYAYNHVALVCPCTIYQVRSENILRIMTGIDLKI